MRNDKALHIASAVRALSGEASLTRAGDLDSIKALCFDFGDTLVNSKIFVSNGDKKAIEEAMRFYHLDGSPARYLSLTERAWDDAGRELDEKYCRGLPLTKHDSQLSGELATRYFAESLTRLMGQVPSQESIASVAEAQLKGIMTADSLFPEVKETLSVLHESYPLGIISDNMAEYVEGPLRHLDLKKFFKVVVISGKEGPGITKPNPEIFRRALSRLKVQPGEALMVGDNTRADIEGARNVGMFTVWVNRNREKLTGTAKPDYIVGDLSGVLDVLSGSFHN